MNLFFKSYKFALIFLFQTALNSALALKYDEFSYQQFTPEIKSYDIPDDYSYGLNYSIFRNSDGVIFIGKQNGIITIDREMLYYTSLPGPVYIAGTNKSDPVFFGKGASGLLSYEAGKGTKAIPSERFPGKDNNITPLGIFENDTSIILLSSTESYYLNSNEAYQVLSYQLDWKKRISGNQFLPEQSRIIITEDNGDITLVDMVLQSKTVLIPSALKPAGPLCMIHTDPFNNIWLLFETDLLKIEAPGGAEYINFHQQFREKILDAYLNDSELFLGTNKALRSLDHATGNWNALPDPSPGNNRSFHQLDGVGTAVFGAGDYSLFRLYHKETDVIREGYFSRIIALDEDQVLANGNSFLEYELNDHHWEESLTDMPYGIEEVFHLNNTIWSLDMQNIVTSLIKDSIPRSIGFPENATIRIFPLNGRCLIKLNENYFLWTEGKDELEPYTELAGKVSDQDAGQIPFFQDSTWLICQLHNSRYLVCRYSEKENEYKPYYEIENPRLFGRMVKVLEDKEHLWLIGNKQVIRLPGTHASSNIPKPVTIQSITRRIAGENKKEKILESTNKIRFFKGVLSFNIGRSLLGSTSGLYHRYRINRYQEEWSDWSKSSSIILQDLHEGKYTLEVQAVSNYGQLSEPITYDFQIKPPFYRSTIAYLFYIFILLVTAFFIYKIRLLSMKNVRTKLELQIKEKMDSLLSEKEKSDRLVEDLLPKSTAEELKAKGRAKSKKFERATVLFSDIQGFTRIAEEMNPEELIDELDKFFFHFDSVVEKYNIEKIKTIGDAYMAAGGIPIKNNTNPVEVVLAGLEMQHYMKELKKTKTDIWDLRIGIHTGPVISGVVGHKKLSYDIWGDTVNTASRMESSGEIGKVNISGTTYSLVKEYFLCEYRGKLPVKYKGNIDMYFVIGLRPELSVDLKGIPNRRFFLKLQLLRLMDLENLLFEEILAERITSLHFHKKEYIMRVYNQSELLARSENVSEDDMLLIQTASLMLYSGLSEAYDNFENRSAVITRDILPSYGYSERQVDRISNLILATKAPFNPQNKLEEILIDAKMEYLGRADYSTQVKLLYLELKEYTGDVNKERLIKNHEKTLTDFHYYTLAAQRLRELQPEEQILKLREWK